LKEAKISEKAKARILMAVKQGYRVLVPKRMVDGADGAPSIAWWQIDLVTGETIGVGEDGTHQFIITLPSELRLFQITMSGSESVLRALTRQHIWRETARVSWEYFWKKAVPDIYHRSQDDPATRENWSLIYFLALKQTKEYLNSEVWNKLQDDLDGLFISFGKPITPEDVK
jgi:hypothetical protein